MSDDGTKQTLTLEWDGVLRLWAADDLRVMASDQHDMIGISLSAAVTPARGPIPIELILTPTAAAGILATLREFEDDGRIPTGVVSSVKTTRQ